MLINWNQIKIPEEMFIQSSGLLSLFVIAVAMYLFTCVVILLLISTATEAILCYNCTNFRDRKKYCQTGEIHHMDKIKCKGKHCLYYDLNKGVKQK